MTIVLESILFMNLVNQFFECYFFALMQSRENTLANYVGSVSLA